MQYGELKVPDAKEIGMLLPLVQSQYPGVKSDLNSLSYIIPFSLFALYCEGHEKILYILNRANTHYGWAIGQ